MRRGLAMTLVVAASCGRCGRTQIEVPPLDEDAALAPVRRDAGAATGRVRAYPPHAIRADGVGPYLLGEDMK